MWVCSVSPAWPTRTNLTHAFIANRCQLFRLNIIFSILISNVLNVKFWLNIKWIFEYVWFFGTGSDFIFGTNKLFYISIFRTVHTSLSVRWRFVYGRSKNLFISQYILNIYVINLLIKNCKWYTPWHFTKALSRSHSLTNVTRFYVMRKINFIFINTEWSAFLAFMLTKLINVRQHYVHLHCTEYHPNLAAGVVSAGRN